MLIEKKDVKRIMKRLEEKKKDHSCQVGVIFLAKPTEHAFSYIHRKKYPVKNYGEFTFFADCKENMLSDTLRWKFSNIFKAYTSNS